MKISLREMIYPQCKFLRYQRSYAWSKAYILVSQMLQELELSVGALGEDGCAEGLHDLLDGDILVGELIASRAAVTLTEATSSMGLCGCFSEHIPDKTESSHPHRLKIRVSIEDIESAAKTQ